MTITDQKLAANTDSPETLSKDMFRWGMKVTYVGMVVNALLIVLKFIGGIIGTSSAMIADSVHSLSDFLTDIGVIIGLKFLYKPADSDHAYGHGRIETMISLLIGIVIIITGIGLLKNAFYDIILSFRGIFPRQPGYIALVMGVISLLSKEALFHYTRTIARKSGSKTLEANAWHHRSDALSSVGTVIGVGGAIILGSRWTFLDPLAAGFVSILVAKVGINIGRNALKELSDESLSYHIRKEVENSIKKVEGVKGHHHVRTRSLGAYVCVDGHVQVDPKITVREGHSIATDVENAVRKTISNAAFVTIHVEPMEYAKNKEH